MKQKYRRIYYYIDFIYYYVILFVLLIHILIQFRNNNTSRMSGFSNFYFITQKNINKRYTIFYIMMNVTRMWKNL